MPKKNNKIVLNMVSYAVLQIVNMLVGLFLPRLYLARYGSEINGIISTVNSFTSYFSYLEAGLGLTMIHALFTPLASKKILDINTVLSYSKKQYVKISGIYLILVVLLSLIFPLISIVSDISFIEFILLIFVIGIYGAIDFYTMAKYRVLLIADRKEYIISLAMIIAQLLRFVFVFVLLKFQISVVFVKIVPILTLFIRSLILKLYVNKKYPYVDFSQKLTNNIPSSSNRWDALLLNVSISTSLSLPTIIVSQVLGFKEANVYAIYSLVASAMIAIVSALSSGVSPMLGIKMAKNEKIDDVYNIYDFIVAFIITLVFSVTAVMFLPFIKLYTNVVDDVNYIYPSYAILISIWAALYSYRIPLTAVINAAGIYRENRINNIVNILIQVLFGVIAAIIWGIFGVLVVMIVSSIHRNICFCLVIKKKLVRGKILVIITRQIIMIFLISLSGIVGNYIFKEIEIGLSLWIFWSFIALFAMFVICFVSFFVIDFSLLKMIILKIKTKKALRTGE